MKNVTLISYSYKRAVLTAKDPNMKHGPEGYVIPGQELNYKIEFENEGAGIAYGVYFTDTLSENLDDSTLKLGPVKSSQNNSVIGPKGIYEPGTRSITWFVGEVGPGNGGYTNLSIKVRIDAQHGTEILNYGIIYFPSVPEVTRTNGIVSTVIINKYPVAVAGNNLIVDTLEEVMFDGSSSSDPDGKIVNYTWEFGDGNKGYGKITPYTYNDNGDYKVKLTVTDNWDGSDDHEIDIQVLNRPPEATLQVDLSEVETNDQVIFDATQSIDLDGEILEYYLDFGDASNSGWIRSSKIVHKYSDGTNDYTAKLSVKDDDGAINENTAEVEITVNNRGPVTALSADKMEAFTYEDILFSAELSLDLDGSIASYYFDFGDGTNSDWLTSPSITHQYTDGPKEYSVELIVKDDDSETSTTDIIISIKNRAPEAAADSDQIVDTNQEIQFNGRQSSDLDGKIKTYHWDFGDGSSSTGKKTSHIYEDNGEYIVTLIVTDDDGATGSDTSVITVNNVKPVAKFNTNPSEGDVTTIFEFSSTSIDNDGSITKFFWDFGDGTTSWMASPSHQYKTTGEFIVSLVVQDDDGSASDPFKKQILINNLPPVAVAESSTARARVGEEISFGAFKSYDIDGQIMSFTWQFGDGTTDYGKRVEHLYEKVGTYTITLTVLDNSENSASTILKIKIIEAISDSDGDSIPDDIDSDDDNDGIPDTWELEYDMNTFDPEDALFDTDSDDLNNLDEYLYDTDPTNPDTDGEGLLDGEEIKIYYTDPTNEDTDGDGIDDKNDENPNDPSSPGTTQVEEQSSPDLLLPGIIILLVAIILIIGILSTILIKKRNNRIRGPFDNDERIRQLRDKIIQGQRIESAELSGAELWEMIQYKYQNGEISEQIYRNMMEEDLNQYSNRYN